jgi:hypothetical protein
VDSGVHAPAWLVSMATQLTVPPYKRIARKSVHRAIASDERWPRAVAFLAGRRAKKDLRRSNLQALAMPTANPGG